MQRLQHIGKRFGVLALIVLALILSHWLLSSVVPPSQTTSPDPIMGLHVLGNQLVDKNNRPVFLRGMALSGPEYTCDILTLPQVQPDQFELMQTWHINTVRLPLSAPYWLNTDNLCPHYRQQISTIVQRAEAHAMEVIFTLQWVAPFDPSGGGGQYPLPDRAEAIPFWTSLAAAYAGDDHALFELFSEPHDIDWTTWVDGGEITSSAVPAQHLLAGTYVAAGMQEMARLVNATAPSRIVLVSGMQWAVDLSEVSTGKWIAGSNIAYSVHPYDHPITLNPANWPSLFGDVALQHPVVATEFGQLDCGHALLDRLMPYLAAHVSGMVAWTWDIGGCQRPGIIADWQGKPSEYGATIKAFYQKLAP